MKATEQQLDKYIKITISLIVILALASAGIYFYYYKQPQIGKLTIAEQQIEALQKKVKKEPRSAQLRIALSKAYLKNKDFNGAKKELKQVLKLEKESTEAYFLLGFIYKNEGKGSYKKAEKQFKKIIDFSEGQQFSKIDTTLKASYSFLGEMNFDQKKYKKALEYFEKSSKIASMDSDVFLFMGRCYYYLKDYKNAEKYYKEAIRFVPNYAEVYYHLGVLYKTKGNNELAKTQFDKALKYKPGYKAAKDALGDL